MSVEDELAHLKGRLDHLERRYGWLRFERWFWRCVSLIILGIAIGVYFVPLEMGYRSLPPPFDIKCERVRCDWVECKSLSASTVTAQGVVVTNSEGKEVATLLPGKDKDGSAALRLWTTDKKLVAIFGVNDQGGGAFLYDRKGKGNVFAGYFNDGGSGFQLEDSKAVRRVEITLIDDKSHIGVRDENGKTVFTKP
jgi:hypothetical protein